MTRNKSEAKTSVPDYRTFRMTFRQIMESLTVYTALAGIVSLLFYNSAVLMLILLPGFFLFLWYRKQQLAKRRRDLLRRQFLTGMQMCATALRAGYAVENAFIETYDQLLGTYGEQAPIVVEFGMIASKLKLNYPIETLLEDLGERSDTEDIRSFAEVFHAARRSGGDLLEIIGNTIAGIERRAQTQQEIQTILAGKQMELNIMSAAPMAILGYIRLSSPELLSSMYGNARGISIMSFCLAVYAGAYVWGNQMLDVEI